MVVGLDTFRSFFADFEDRYALIGGVACDLLFNLAELPFRATKDLDIVLCVEVVDAAFGARFQEFIEAGGYRNRATAEGERRFYRFDKPSDPAFPAMIELFARPSAALDLPDKDRYVRLSVEETVVSLSALLLDPAYYEALLAHRQQVDGLTILTEDLLIPFKAKAFLDLSERAAKGEKVDSNNVRKHRNDVYRLLQLMPADRQVILPDPLKADINRFVTALAGETFNPKDFKVSISKEAGIEMLTQIYLTASA